MEVMSLKRFGYDILSKSYPKGHKPYDTITSPFADEDGDVFYYKYDHDEGCWVEERFYLCSKEEFESLKEIGFY